MKVKDQWVENERLGDLNIAPLSSPLAPGIEGLPLKLVPSWSRSNNLLLMLKKEKLWLLNPPSPPKKKKTVEEPANELTSGFMGDHELINLEEEEPAAAIDNDPHP